MEMQRSVVEMVMKCSDFDVLMSIVIKTIQDAGCTSEEIEVICPKCDVAYPGLIGLEARGNAILNICNTPWRLFRLKWGVTSRGERAYRLIFVPHNLLEQFLYAQSTF
jgi:hypothetical protein